VKRGRKPQGVVWSQPAPADAAAGSFSRLVPLWLRDLEVRQYTPASRTTWASGMGQFAAWCGERGLSDAIQVTRSVMEAYQRHLAFVRSGQPRTSRQGRSRAAPAADGPAGHPLTSGRQRARLHAVRRFYTWAVRQGHVPANPAADLEYPRLSKRLPDVLSADEVAAVLGGCDLGSLEGVRDRAFIELLAATGLRRTEACRLVLADLDPERGIVRVREGKGRKDRYVPAGARAFAWLSRYLTEVRPRWALSVADDVVFLRPDGRPVTDGLMGGRVHRLLALAGITKRGACHLFRHTFATGLLENGCDIRLIGAMLGHSNLSATAVYTHVGVGLLVQAHAAFHRTAGATAAKEEGRAAAGSQGAEPGQNTEEVTP
jgi:integrase/recombinase XerD